LLRRVAEHPPDIFVPNLVVPAFYAARFIRAAGIPTVGLLRSDDAFYAGILDVFAAGEEMWRVSALVAVSAFLAREARRRSPTDMLIRQIPSGAPLPSETARRHSGTLRLVYTGRLVEEQKRSSEVARALCRAAREIPGIEAIIYGDGEARPAVEHILQTEGQGLPVWLLGQIDSDTLQQQLLECHVIVLLSDYEGLPTSVMEGMACGLVPVCLRLRSGIDELVEHEQTGLLVDDRGTQFVAAIRRLAEDPTLWERLSQAARARIEENYSTTATAERWLELAQILRSSAPERMPMKMPRQLELPPVHPVLAREDRRPPHWYRLPEAWMMRMLRFIRYRALHWLDVLWSRR
jgi:glycosyltransferase involved in cell wall biosynthesis